MYVTSVNMASQVEDNKRDSLVLVMNEIESHMKIVYEKCEQILNNENETFQNKAESLVDAWKQLRLCGASAKVTHIIHLMDWAKLHTLNIVLSGDWKKYKDAFETRLLNELEICEKELHKVNNSFSLHCKKLRKVIQDPWGNPTLCKLLNTQDPAITKEEFDFFTGESGYLVSMRLKKLCESHCEDLGLNLVTAYMRCCDWAEENKFNMNLTEDQKRFMLDVYIALLYKYKKTPVILSKLKLLTLKEGLELVKRFARKRVEISKLWRYSNRITHLAAVLFASSAIIQPYDVSGPVLTELVEVWLNLSDKEEDGTEALITSIRRVMQVSTSASHMYIFCEAIHKKFGKCMKTFNIELYIQALTTDLNYLERQKQESNKFEVQQTSQRLAHGFLGLADVLDDHLNVCRECVLTSFSLKPTKACLNRIEDLAKRCGYEVLDTGQWKCKMHPPVQPSDELCSQCSECGDFMSQLHLEAAINTNVALNEALTAERLGLSPELCDDLVVVLCSPRYHLLNWLQKWPELHRLCIMYLNDPERTKNLVTELKFLDIDYSLFMNVKKEPEEEDEEQEEIEYYGYEDSVDQEYFANSHLNANKKSRKKPGRKKVVKKEDLPSDSFVPPRASTDPNVLKSLRSFRRNLKRPKDDEMDAAPPSKMFIDPSLYNRAYQPHSTFIPQATNTGILPGANFSYFANPNSPTPLRGNAANIGLGSYLYPYYYGNPAGNSSSLNNDSKYQARANAPITNISDQLKSKLNPTTAISSRFSSPNVKGYSGPKSKASFGIQPSVSSTSHTYTQTNTDSINRIVKPNTDKKVSLNKSTSNLPRSNSNTSTIPSNKEDIKESVDKLSKSITERLINSLSNELQQTKPESERLMSMKKILQLTSTLAPSYLAKVGSIAKQSQKDDKQSAIPLNLTSSPKDESKLNNKPPGNSTKRLVQPTTPKREDITLESLLGDKSKYGESYRQSKKTQNNERTANEHAITEPTTDNNRHIFCGSATQPNETISCTEEKVPPWKPTIDPIPEEHNIIEAMNIADEINITAKIPVNEKIKLTEQIKETKEIISTEDIRKTKEIKSTEKIRETSKIKCTEHIKEIKKIKSTGKIRESTKIKSTEEKTDREVHMTEEITNSDEIAKTKKVQMVEEIKSTEKANDTLHAKNTEEIKEAPTNATKEQMKKCEEVKQLVDSKKVSSKAGTIKGAVQKKPAKLKTISRHTKACVRNICISNSSFEEFSSQIMRSDGSISKFWTIEDKASLKSGSRMKLSNVVDKPSKLFATKRENFGSKYSTMKRREIESENVDGGNNSNTFFSLGTRKRSRSIGPCRPCTCCGNSTFAKRARRSKSVDQMLISQKPKPTKEKKGRAASDLNCDMKNKHFLASSKRRSKSVSHIKPKTVKLSRNKSLQSYISDRESNSDSEAEDSVNTSKPAKKISTKIIKDLKRKDSSEKLCAFQFMTKFLKKLNGSVDKNIVEESSDLFQSTEYDGNSSRKCSACLNISLINFSTMEELMRRTFKAVDDSSKVNRKCRYKIADLNFFHTVYENIGELHKNISKFRKTSHHEQSDKLKEEALRIKYNLKDLRVVLTRIDSESDYKDKTNKNALGMGEKKLPHKSIKSKTKSKKTSKCSENKSKPLSPTLTKKDNKMRSWPLQDVNPRVTLNNNIHKVDLHMEKIEKPFKSKSDSLDFEKLTDKTELKKVLEHDTGVKRKPPDKHDHFKSDNGKNSSVDNLGKEDKKDKKDDGKGGDNLGDSRIPRVHLSRLDVHSILANVPGLYDTQLMIPSNVNKIVQVVQIAGGRPSATVQTQNNQTSTQVSPHIQRIGQPRVEKQEQSATETTSSSNTKTSPTIVNTKATTSQPSTLINILSQQIIRPGQSNSTRPRTGPFINILSQQIIRPANNTITSSKTTETQPNSSTRILTPAEPQVINQLVNPVRSSNTTLKTVVTNPGGDQSRIVQLICKSADGKLIPVTSFTQNRVVKVATTQAVSSSSPISTNFEDGLTKLVQVSPKPKNESTENSETLPKFQQAFGKTVYQNNIETNNTTATTTAVTTTNDSSSNADAEKTKVQNKTTSSVNVQPIQGGVIYTRQVPVAQTINLIPPNRGQVFRIATSNSEQISLVKDTTVIHNKMSALLAAALQGKQKNSEVIEVDSTAQTTTSSQTTNTRVTLTRPTLVHNARIVKPVIQIPSNVIRSTPQTNLSSTTLEQLREFDMVYKQVKERSSTTTPSDSSSDNTESTQRISVAYINQPPKVNCSPVVVVSSYNNLQPAASPALSVASQGSSSPCVTPAPTPTPVLPKVASKASKGKSVKTTTMHTSKASPLPKPQQKPQEDEHTTQRIFDILAEYAEQLRNSPDLNNKPAPRRRSNPPTNPSQNSKRKKSSSSKKSGHCSSTLTSEADLDDQRTMGSEDSSCGVVQVSLPEEENSTAANASATESNDSTIQPRQQLILTESGSNQTRNLIITDSSVGEALKMPNTAVLVPGNYIMPVSMVKGGQQIAVVSGGSKILATVPARSGPNMLLFQSFLNQTRKTAVPTVKYSTIQPIAGLSPQNISGVSTQQPVILQQPSTHGISTVTLSQPLPIKKLDEPDRINTELLLTISQSRESDTPPNDETTQPDSSTNIATNNIESIDLEESATLSDTSSEKTFTYQKPIVTTPIATPVIAQTNAKDEGATTASQVATTKAEERVQTVLVTAGASNGPMLSHSPPRYAKVNENSTSSDQSKEEFLRNGGKRSGNASESKNFQSSNNLYTIQGKIKKAQTNNQKHDKELHQICLQRKQAALERELRLQKSLSEECEDLGVDEPSTSDLFPEADLLFDSNHSPSFDQTSQDIVKRPIMHCHENKEESKLTLFSDDDFLFEPGEYQGEEGELEYNDQPRILTNGQSGASNESGSPCGDNTLLRTCTTMSDVTLNSPISPDTYNATTPPPLNKYVHKYSNRKKDRLKQVENWPVDVSSSEDTTGSTELGKSLSRSPELCLNKKSDEEMSENNFKVVRVAISKSECDEIHCSEDADCSMSGRGARRTVKKMCSCCNGSQDPAASRKRPNPQSHTPIPHKKAFLTKKR